MVKLGGELRTYSHADEIKKFIRRMKRISPEDKEEALKLLEDIEEEEDKSTNWYGLDLGERCLIATVEEPVLRHEKQRILVKIYKAVVKTERLGRMKLERDRELYAQVLGVVEEYRKEKDAQGKPLSKYISSRDIPEEQRKPLEEKVLSYDSPVTRFHGKIKKVFFEN
ncbi:MAG: hypothetical protein V3V78_00600 [Candidatus Woesearchaeota archaeon]